MFLIKPVPSPVEWASLPPLILKPKLRGALGAAMFFGALCYPGTDKKAHQRREQLHQALFALAAFISLDAAGFSRVTQRQWGLARSGRALRGLMRVEYSRAPSASIAFAARTVQ